MADSTAGMVSMASGVTELPATFWGTRAHAIALLASLALLLFAFGPALADLMNTWSIRDEYSHGYLMPFVAAWVIWEHRARWRSLRPHSSLWGVILLVPCLAAVLVGEMRVLMWLPPFAFVGALMAVLVAFYGLPSLRLALPPLIVLGLMCPLPGRVQDAITVPLQNVAAVLATGMLDVSGIPAALEGNLIRLPGIDHLWVAEACSGIRSLISLFSLSILYCLFWNRGWGMKLAVVAAAAPISVLVNGLRIWLTGFISVKVSPAAAQGFFHDFEGILLFAVAGLLLVAWVLTLGLVFPAQREESHA